MKSRSFRARPRLRPVPYRVARLRERAVAAAALLCKQRRRRTSAPDAEWESWRGYAESLATNGASAAEEEEEEVVVVEEEVESSDGSPLLTALQCPKGGAVLLLTPAQKLTFTGKCQMICLYGCVEVFGFIISQGQPEYSLFSPHTHSALTIEAMSHKQPDKKKKNTRMEARAILKHYLPLVSRRTLMKKFSPECSIVLLTSLEDWITSFILSHQDYASIFATKQKERHYCVVPRDPALKAIGIEQLQADCGHVMSESSILATEELVQACVEENDGYPVILVCGPRNVGKSAFNRYLINVLLNQIPCVEYLEFDLGQTEFTPPGCISFFNITEPLLGPPFTHQREPHKMVYYGETSCEHDLERYIETVKYMLCFCKREAPLVVNTMGWVKGFGLMLLIDIIRLLSPSHIVQLSVKDVEDLAPLTPEYVQSATGLHTKGKLQVKHKSLGLMGAQDPEQQEEGKDGLRFQMSTGHKLLCVQSNFRGVGDPGSVRCHSSILRDLATLSYLSKMQPVELEQLIPIHSLIPYQVPFNAVALWTIHSDVAPTHIMYTVNASWVGLCRILEDFRYQLERPILLTQTPVCDCLGFGIVRGIDMEKKMYHILTPVAPEKLRLVNCLLVGSITIPHSIFKNQPGIKGEAPYVTSAYSFEISGAGKIKVNKQLKRREHQRTH
ncbi:polynucleotide 5'-hydroxyl-kinase NOL9 isoform X1 [Rhinatrema bivittatum]|uniref:polynucleotide 5'-hydroxyl-kinase NOL9 isoform X1 n=1 Tax=Rhinatrema bivittatum TaxID=194408 RepID=UPI001125D608|nr:polynucleotide 5'-hydroxyl-kinase NOL9 isoform X1 [Rhinatrema bivittatum]